MFTNKIAMERTIRETIEKYEPRVRLIDIKITDNLDDNDLNVTIVFTLKNTDTPITISTILSRVR